MPSPTYHQEISIMLELGFMIDNYLIKRACNLSNDPWIDKQLLDHLKAIGEITLSRAQGLQRGEGCF